MVRRWSGDSILRSMKGDILIMGGKVTKGKWQEVSQTSNARNLDSPIYRLECSNWTMGPDSYGYRIKVGDLEEVAKRLSD